LARLLRLRVAQINDCTYCLNVHYDAARNVGIQQAKIDFLSAWWETQLFSEAERAALQYAVALPAQPTPRLPGRSSSITTRWLPTSLSPQCWRSWRWSST
jgi:AhpD family alkylhydroperoxidase